ncbi:MAG: SRPBCC family protein [Gilvibacter sp.]
MKIEGSITINKPRHTVVALFEDPKNLAEYQDGFKRKELLSGAELQDGSKAKMHYKQGKRDMVLTETVLSNKLPDFFEAHYHHKHMDNTMKSTFVAINETQTRYDYLVHYTRISWVLPKLIAVLYPGMFRKQVEKWMRQFKAFTENQ